MDTFEIINISFVSCVFIAVIIVSFWKIFKPKVFGFESDRAFRRTVHDLFCMFIGYIGNTKYCIDEYRTTYFLYDYYSWSKKSKRYKSKHPISSKLLFFEKCKNDLPLCFCISGIEQYVPYDDVFGDFLGFYVVRCGIRSEFGSYCSCFYNEWMKFWMQNETEFGKVKILVGRDLWKRGFIFDDIPEQIKTTAEKILAEHHAVEEKHEYTKYRR